MTHALEPLRSLIIEDCEDDHDLLLLKLRQSGFEPAARRVETIPDIKDALARQEWQIIFSDFNLPGFDGLRALDLVRARDPEVPFFIVSGVIDEEQAVAAMKAGAQDYFFKDKLARLGPAVSRELQEAEQRRRRRQAQAVMSHEFRTPLNIINVAAGMMARYGERMGVSGRQERISEIQEAVGRMTRIIDNVLLTSRIELRQWDLRPETFDLAVWCEDFLAYNVAGADHWRRVRLQFSDLPPIVTMDRHIIEIALQNLISNALKYSPSDSPVDLQVHGQKPGRIAFTIQDYGIGIPLQDMPHILNSFYRASNAGDVPGSGLGLAIVKGCTDLHGGTLHIESQPGLGTCIRMCLPDCLQSRDTAEEISVSQAELIRT